MISIKDFEFFFVFYDFFCKAEKKNEQISKEHFYQLIVQIIVSSLLKF